MGEMGELESDPWMAGPLDAAAEGGLPAHVRPGRRPSRSRAARVDREVLAEQAQVDPELTPRLQQLWDSAREDAIRLADRFLALEPFWHDLEADDGDQDAYAAEVVAIALALRCTTTVADRQVRDAHQGVTLLPATFDLLAAGDFPAAWFDRLLARTRHLDESALALVDETVSRWPLSLTNEQFRRRLSHLLARLETQQETPPHQSAEGRRRVELLAPGEDGTGCLQLVGPIPEILSLAHRLDSTARAVQTAQRHALEDGTEVPGDSDGAVADTATPSSLARIQYDLLTTATLETGTIAVAEDRFRLNVTVPVLTLLGASAEPGTLEGTTPIPAAMARELAGNSRIWHRVLTDAATGEFLPLPAQRYRPTPDMLEHLRLRHATCAVPGCTRPSSWASEADHITEYDHTDPTRGGLTTIDNLHLLCWLHHRLKTAGLLDPVRRPRTPGTPGATEWTIHNGFRTLITDDVDLATPTTVHELTHSWQRYQQQQHARRPAPEPAREPPPPRPPPPF